MQTITITFGEQAENHVGMQKLGNGLAESGFTLWDLKNIKQNFKNKGCKCKLVNLSREESDSAAILIIRKGVDIMTDSDGLFEELLGLPWDKKAFMYGRVVNKKARYNLCFDKNGQTPDYENGKGRVVAYSDVPYLNVIKKKLTKYFGPKAKHMKAEGNFYYDDNCGIGFHGDSERKCVIALRLGSSMELRYQWYQNGKSIGDPIKFNIRHGDIYVMSEKATGHDWKKRKILTLRHAAGAL